jgi:hypothetical protein
MGEWRVSGLDILEEAKKQVHMVRENLRVANREKRVTPTIEGES